VTGTASAAVDLMVRNWVLAELAVSGAAGCFAVVSLARLAGERRAVLYLLTAPAAIFLMAGYAECLFLALAIPAWHAATRGRWWRAALLAGLSGLVRPAAQVPNCALAGSHPRSGRPAGSRLVPVMPAGRRWRRCALR
jgi:mannosyltransferase PIG-V